MSEWSASNDLAVAAFVARWTAILALAWLGHAALAGSNPRWRVALWRSAMVALGVVVPLTFAPPVLTIPVVPASEAVVVPSDVMPSTRPPRDPGLMRIAPAPGRQGPEPGAATVPASAGRPTTGSRWIVPALLSLWAVGVAALAARMALAWSGLGRIIGRSEDAPGPVVGQCREVAGAIGAPAVRIACSAEMATPCLAGLRRPVLLLPARALSADDLRAVLAHELAHARGHDLAWNLAAHCMTTLLWFHPLAWRLRSAHASACDAVCDAVAADFLGDVPAYSRTLARLALAALAPPPAPALAMARSSDVRRRVAALDREVFRAPLPRRVALAATFGGGVLLILIGGLAVTDASPPASARSSAGASDLGAGDEPPAAPDADGRLEVRAVADATGQPLRDIAIAWELRINQGQYTRKDNSTDGDGRAALGWPKGATVNGLTVTARKPGFVPYLIRWDDRARPLRLPAVKVLRLVPGITIGGVVRDEADRPVAGARVTVNAPPTEAEASNYSTELAEARTDDRGRWTVDDVPADLNRVSVAIQAAGFVRGGGPPSRDLEASTVLRRGFAVKGRVLDARGNPVAGARVSGGDNWSQEPKPTKTDALGVFVLESCPTGASPVTVRAEGYAPDLREVHPEDRPTLEFRLEPGRTLRGKVVDRRGRPVAGAMVAADTWREHRSLDFRVDTDKEGRFEWRDAPDDAVLYGVGKDGSMYRRDVALAPSDAEQVVTLDPELVISGRVTDAATGRLVPTFRVVRGLVFPNNSRVNWIVQDAAGFADGRYTLKHSEPFAGYAVRIESAGYKPADSPVFRPGEAAASFDVALHRAGAADILTGVVHRPDGRPAAGVEVALATPEHPLVFEMDSYRFGRSNGMSFAKTGPDGRFSFGHPGDHYRLAAMGDDGYAEATPEQVEKSATLDLQPWGKIRGVVRIGRQAAANQPVTVVRRDEEPGRPEAVHAFYNVETRTDAQGRFAFDRVIPGASEVARVVITEFGNGSQQHMGCWQEPVDVAPGQTVEVVIGGKGRPVVGRVALQAPPGFLVDWRRNRPATIERARPFGLFAGMLGQLQGPPGLDPRRNDRFAAGLDKDGRFRVDDVPPGQYELTVTIDAPPASGRPGPAQELGRARVLLVVPEGDDGAAVDLGEVSAKVKGG